MVTEAEALNQILRNLESVVKKDMTKDDVNEAINNVAAENNSNLTPP